MADDRIDIEGSDLSALIAAEIAAARSYTNEEIKGTRDRNIDYYNGTMRDVESQPNRSRVVSTDVKDTISWMLPGIMRVFTNSDTMAKFEPQTEKDVEGAAQATDYINYLFFRFNHGYRILYDATFDALQLGNAITYATWDMAEQSKVTVHTRMSLPALQQVLDDPEVEIIEQAQNPEPDTMPVPDPATGQMVDMQVPTFDIKLKRTDKRGRLVMSALRPENFFIDQEAVNTDDARFCAYLHEFKTRSDLIEMGFDADIVADLKPGSGTDLNVGINRSNGLTQRSSKLKSQDLIDLYECYIRADMDDDGVAETIRVWYAGHQGAGKVLKHEQWDDDLPFTDIPCYPIPHVWAADSAAARTTEIQKIKTILTRQALDNLYAANLPMREVDTGSVENPDILTSPKFGGIIWKRPGSNPIQPHAVPFVADKAFSALEYFDQVRAQSTGVSRSTMALDPDAIQGQTATANQNQHDSAYSQIELVARNMAELGWSRFFAKVLKLVVKHQDRPAVVRLRDTFVEMDPRVWAADMDVTINVGLGTGSRERDIMMLQGVLQNQTMLADRFAGAGMSEQALELLPKAIATMKKIAEAAGLKNPDEFYPDFDEQTLAQLKQNAAQQAQQPDPKTQMEQQKLQAQMQLEQQKAQAATAKEAAQMQADMAVNEQRQQFEMFKFQQEMSFRQTELAQQREIELLKLGMKDMGNPDGTAQPKDKLDLIAESLMASTQAVMQAMSQVQQGQHALAMHLSAPTEIVRDPATGKAVGTRKVLN